MPRVQYPDIMSEGFNSYEAPVIATLQRYLDKDTNGPLLTLNERDILLPPEEPFFTVVSQSAVPKDAVNKLHSGELTREQLARKMQIARNIVRKGKADMFAERVMTATYATDTCRSLFWVATGGEFVPVEVDDTAETVTHRVGDYVTDLLQGGRDSGLLQNASMQRLTDTIRAKFDNEPGAVRVLTPMAGINSRKKVTLFVDELFKVSRGYGSMTKTTRDKLYDYADGRAAAFKGKLDLRALLEGKKVA